MGLSNFPQQGLFWAWACCFSFQTGWEPRGPPRRHTWSLPVGCSCVALMRTYQVGPLLEGGRRWGLQWGVGGGQQAESDVCVCEREMDDLGQSSLGWESRRVCALGVRGEGSVPCPRDCTSCRCEAGHGYWKSRRFLHSGLGREWQLHLPFLPSRASCPRGPPACPCSLYVRAV